MTSVVVADVDEHPDGIALAQRLVARLRGAGVAVFVCDRAGSGSRGSIGLPGVVRRVLAGAGDRPNLVLFGDEARQRRAVWRLALAGLLPRVRLFVHARAARIPYPPSSAELFARAEVVLTESQLGARAVHRCCTEAGAPVPRLVVTSPAFPSRRSAAAPAPDVRRALRRAHLDLDDDGLVVGCWAGAELEVVLSAVDIFWRFTRGLYRWCDRCGHLTPWPVAEDLHPLPVERCGRCGSRCGTAGRVREDTRLLLFGVATDGDGDWGPRQLGGLLGLADHITEVPGSAVPAADLSGCVDIHLQPHVLADVPPAVRRSCVLGVPIVATGYGAIAAWPRGVAELVPPRMVVDGSAGHRTAVMDPGAALGPLARLGGDRAARLAAAANARAFADGAGDPLDRWVSLLDAAGTV